MDGHEMALQAHLNFRWTEITEMFAILNSIRGYDGHLNMF